MPNSVSKAWDYLKERFGVTREDISEYDLKQVSGDIWIVSDGLETGLEVETYGIRFIRVMDIGLKPTTYGLQLIEEQIEKNVVELDQEEMIDMLDRERMVPREMEEDGYVALKYEGRIVGCGFYKGEKVSSRIPKGRSKELRQIIE